MQILNINYNNLIMAVTQKESKFMKPKLFQQNNINITLKSFQTQ